ncbi:uncharacterized protein LOC113367801 [Ctenocephalides felis]|uniref:uncharacterized protein LOC113367801 n=1 Tax=Ctenocephalides felis TaxID=7515 RepID=UPI000E6E4D05|nr:uncharacterized protein LOC113367801 [Ctenocephalides felis]
MSTRPQVEYENIQSGEPKKQESKSVVLPRRHQSLNDVPSTQDVDRASMDFENLVESDFNFETDDAFYEPGEVPVDEIDTAVSAAARPRLASADAAVSVTIPGVNLDKNTIAEHDVSCEDLLDFAGRKPPGRARGVESDEVRIMNKVLGKEMTPEACLVSLEHMDWDVHRAIKLARLRLLLNNSTIATTGNVELKTVIDNLSNKDLVSALDTASWDITKAACCLYEKHGS